MDESFAEAIDKAALKRLARRSNARGLAQLAGHLAALAATAALVAWARGTWWLPAAMLGHGVVLVFLFAPLHESLHRTAFRSRRLNDAVAWLCGAPLLLPPEYFRAYHFAHHRFTQDPLRDPELDPPAPATLGRYLWVASGLPLWADRLVRLARHAFTARVPERFVPARLHPAIRREARVLLGLLGALAAASLALQSAAALVFWLGPALLGQPLLRLYLMAEHGACPLVPEMLANSRTTRSNWLVRRLAWNMPYHAEHHAYPALPFHALPAAHALLEDRIAVKAPGYLAAHGAILAALGPRPAGARPHPRT